MTDRDQTRAGETTHGVSTAAAPQSPSGPLRAVEPASGPRSQAKGRRKPLGVEVPRHFTNPAVHPFDTVAWEKRSAIIANERGEVIFEQNDVEIPAEWSQLATNVVASKYFRGHLNTAERETSVKELIGRVIDRIHEWGSKGGYFRSEADGETFRAELAHLVVTQKMAFNSPVWFNLGVRDTPQQASACFINSVQDTMESIMNLAKTEAMLFKGGSGTGSNLSSIRSSKEKLTGGGTASGPVSFMRGLDSFAGVIKSGGKTRRAAKMVILNVEHPDIREFVHSKADEEKKAWSLIDAGYDGGFNVPGGAYDSVFFQNANHSVRVSDDFMRAGQDGRSWQTRSVTTGEVIDSFGASDLLDEIAEAAHLCGDPGMQYDTTINRWNPVKASGRINASNPCAEYMFLDDTACNLASLNLMNFVDEEGCFDVAGFRRAASLTILAQEILVDFAHYPTPAIGKNSHLFRPLGLGYANLGALLMNQGLRYDSEEGRNLSAAITSLMCGEAYRTSAEVAEAMGPFSRYRMNRRPFLEVVDMHKTASEAVPRTGVQDDLWEEQRSVWAEALERGQKHGYRNAQVTVLAPTGTIAFMMDCDTTGVEPDIALVKYKKLVGGGLLKLVNGTVPKALGRLGYDESQTAEIIGFIDEHETIEGAPHLKASDLAVFDCAFRPMNGVRSIAWMGHLRMMGAVQPFLSGAISKTVNLPTEATVQDLRQAYLEGWKLGLKALAVYRDGSKRTQPLNAGKETDASGKVVHLAERRAVRIKLPDTRQSLTHKFSIAGHEGYITVGSYDDGTPGELFLRMAKEGSTVSGLMDTIGIMTSMALQYGVPLKALVDKFSHTRFEPAGFTNNPEIPMAKSITDYIFRFLGNRFLSQEALVPDEQESDAEATGLVLRAAVAGGSVGTQETAHSTFQNQADAPACVECGSITVRNGACYKCPNCGAASGCS